MGMDGVVAYPVQIINKPHKIIALKIWHALRVLLPVKYVVEFVVEPGRGAVEAMESLQGRGTG
jgi:hypothetical protein